MEIVVIGRIAHLIVVRIQWEGLNSLLRLRAYFLARTWMARPSPMLRRGRSILERQRYGTLVEWAGPRIELSPCPVACVVPQRYCLCERV